jgi:hypothetical protein
MPSPEYDFSWADKIICDLYFSLSSDLTQSKTALAYWIHLAISLSIKSGKALTNHKNYLKKTP